MNSNLIYTLLSGLVGVVIGSVLSWLINNKLEKEKIKRDLRIKVVEEIINDIHIILNLLKEMYSLNSSMNMFTEIYTEEKNEGKNKELKYEVAELKAKELSKKHDEVLTVFNKLDTQFNTKEIVIKDYIDTFENLYKEFRQLIRNFTECLLYSSDIRERVKLSKSIKLHLLNIQVTKDKLESNYNKFVLNLLQLNNDLQNDVYKEIFKVTKNDRIYEVKEGKIYPIERLYKKEIATIMYSNDKVKNDLLSIKTLDK